MERSGSGKECSFDNPGDDVKDYEKIENYGLFSNGTLKIFTGEVITIPTTKGLSPSSANARLTVWKNPPGVTGQAVPLVVVRGFGPGMPSPIREMAGGSAS